jgi:serine protease
MIDTGPADIPDLAGKIDSRWTVTAEGTVVPAADSTDALGHGTAVASLIAANPDDGVGMAGFGGAAHVIAVHADNQGYFVDTKIAIALTNLVSLGARIVNLSLGGQQPSAPVLVDAIHQAAAHGVLLVAAAGNEHSSVSWPAADLQPDGGGRGYGLAVGAADHDGNPADFSNSGEHLSLVAPGSYGGSCFGVLAALPAESAIDDSCYPRWTSADGARYAYLAGTSFAAPEVAGVAALVWAVRPDLANYEVADIIKESARRETATDWTPTRGCGELDAGKAVELAMAYPDRPRAEARVGTRAGVPATSRRPGRARSTRQSRSHRSPTKPSAIPTFGSARRRHPGYRSRSAQAATAPFVMQPSTSSEQGPAASPRPNPVTRTTTPRPPSHGASRSPPPRPGACAQSPQQSSGARS